MSNNSASQKLAELSISLPDAPPKGGIYKPCLIDGKCLYVSGHGPYLGDGKYITGRVGKDLDQEQAKAAARQVGLAILASIQAQLGSIDRVKRVIKILGMVNCTPEFEKQPYVINGCSELFASIWGDDLGVGVRSAVGMVVLPNQIAVEIEALFELH